MPSSPSVPSLAPAIQHLSSQPGARPGRAACTDPWGPRALQTLCQVSTGVGFWEAQTWCCGVAADPRGSSKAQCPGWVLPLPAPHRTAAAAPPGLPWRGQGGAVCVPCLSGPSTL